MSVFYKICEIIYFGPGSFREEDIIHEKDKIQGRRKHIIQGKGSITDVFLKVLQNISD